MLFALSVRGRLVLWHCNKLCAQFDLLSQCSVLLARFDIVGLIEDSDSGARMPCDYHVHHKKCFRSCLNNVWTMCLDTVGIMEGSEDIVSPMSGNCSIYVRKRCVLQIVFWCLLRLGLYRRCLDVISALSRRYLDII